MNAEQRLADNLEVSSQIKQCTVGGFKLNYLIAGQGEPVLLLHGANIGWGMWYGNIAALAKNYKVIALDLPGAGASDLPDISRVSLEEAFVAKVEELLFFLGIKDLFVVGHSFGGWVALKLALRNRVNIKKVVLVDSLGFSLKIPISQWPVTVYLAAKIISQTVFKITRANTDKFLQSAFYDKKVLTEVFQQYYFESLSRVNALHPLLFLNGLSSFLRMRTELDLKNVLPSLRSPVLIVWGEKDSNIPLKYNSKNFQRIPNHTVQVIKDAGHVPCLEKSPLFNTLVLNFFTN